jgi:hypothetical protein
VQLFYVGCTALSSGSCHLPKRGIAVQLFYVGCTALSSGSYHLPVSVFRPAGEKQIHKIVKYLAAAG